MPLQTRIYNNQHIIFENLPQEILFQIFANLSINEIIKFNRLSKRLRQLVDNYLIQEIKIKQIACGHNFSLILLESGRVFAMGANNDGQLGLLEEKNRLIPTEVSGLEPIDYLSVGFAHAIMLSKKKKIWVMGNNREQQLSFNKQSCEKLVLQCVPTTTSVQSVMASDFSTVYGDDNGIYQFGNKDLKPYKINGILKLLPAWVQRPIGLNIIDMSAGKEHALLLTTEGHVYGIGSNQHGLLGLGNTITDCKKWTLLPIKQAIKIKATDLASFILKNNQDLMVTGINSARQLENSNRTYFSSFKKIATKIINFDAHEFHTIYVDTSQNLHALGHNDHGQLGIGFAKDQKVNCPTGLLRINKPETSSPKIDKKNEGSNLSLITLLESTSPFFKFGKSKEIKERIYWPGNTFKAFN